MTLSAFADNAYVRHVQQTLEFMDADLTPHNRRVPVQKRRARLQFKSSNVNAMMGDTHGL